MNGFLHYIGVSQEMANITHKESFMKKAFVFLSILVIAFLASIFPINNGFVQISTGILVGDEAIVPEARWVDVKSNPIELIFGSVDTCVIDFGGGVRVVKIHDEKNLVVKYTAPDDWGGTRCPSGVKFVISGEEFATMNEQYVKIVTAQRAEKTLVGEILSKGYFGPVSSAGDWDWVRVVNPDPIRQIFSNGEEYLFYGDICGIGEDDLHPGGAIQVRGEADNGRMLLYEYTAFGVPRGTPCPSGVLFFR